MGHGFLADVRGTFYKFMPIFFIDIYIYNIDARSPNQCLYHVNRSSVASHSDLFIEDYIVNRFIWLAPN